MSKKLWEWGAQKRKPTVCAINAQSGTGLKIAPPPPSACNIGNGNSCKIPCKPYARTIVALIQSSYEQEAVGMRSTKTQTPRLCNQRTKRNELANRSASTIGVQYRRWKFVQIPCKPYARTIVALMQCTYEEEAVGMGSPKTQTLHLCNQPTKRYELANRSATTISVHYRQWKFVQIPCKP